MFFCVTWLIHVWCIYMYVYIYIYVYVYTHIYIYRFVCKMYIDIYNYTSWDLCVYMYTWHVCTYMYTHTCIHIHVHVYTYMYTHTCIHIHVHTYMYTHTCIQRSYISKIMHIHTHTHTHMHTHTHTHTHTCTHSHKHKHTNSEFLLGMSSLWSLHHYRFYSFSWYFLAFFVLFFRTWNSTMPHEMLLGILWVSNPSTAN